MRIRYWSGSKFAKWVRGKFGNRVKPNALGFDEWVDWDDDYYKEHPFVFWFTEEFLDRVQDVVMWPSDLYHSIRYKFVLRFIDCKHVLNTRLDKWQWHDCDTRILHGLFETLVDFVEVEKAHMSLICDPEVRTHKWYQFKFLRWNRVRSRELGIKYLEWEMTLEKGEPMECNPAQAFAAREQYELYTWWKDVRPNRPDPHDASGWTEICESRTNECETTDRKRGWMRSFADRSEAEREESRAAILRSNEIEQQYDDEDTQQLIRLIKIRKSMWT